MNLEIEEQIATLLTANVLFVNDGHWRKDWPKDHISMHVLCNDVFAWGCADAEDILYSEIEDLYFMHLKDPKGGADAWCIKKRKQMPQEPVAKQIRQAGIWNLDELVKKD